MSGTAGGSERTHDVRRYAKARRGPVERGGILARTVTRNTLQINVLSRRWVNRWGAHPTRHECALRQPLPGADGGIFCHDTPRPPGRRARESARPARWTRGTSPVCAVGANGSVCPGCGSDDGAPGAPPPSGAYRLRFTNSCSISSLLVITRELAWKPRCVTIMFVNSWARSTFDISSAPLVIVDWTPSSA